eukprot:jgi/Astpho2/5440/Aster-07389
MARRAGSKMKQAPAHKGLPEEMEDEIDAFHKSKDIVSLDPEADTSDSEAEEDAEGLYDINSDKDSLGDSEDQDSEGGSGRLAKLKRVEKAIRAKVQLQQGQDEDDEEELGDERPGSHVWGKSNKALYGADTQDYELTDDEEALKEEEEEALRLQHEAANALQPEDFGGDSGGDSEDEEAGERAEPTLGQRAQQAAQGPAVEAVLKDLAGMTDEQQLAAVTADAPELAGLLQQLHAGLTEVRTGALATAEGISYLEAKHLLLLNYCMCIVFYLLLKAEGRPVREHPVIVRLVELRAYLEKIRPIDRKLQYQMDKLLLAAKSMQGPKQQDGEQDADAAADPLMYGPKPDQLISKAGAALGGDTPASGVYRPPKLNPVAMQDDPDKDYGKKQRRRQEHKARTAGRSELLRELAHEIQDAPQEVRTGSDPAGSATLASLRHRQHLEARAAEEEDMFARVPLSREDRRRLKADMRAGLAGQGAMLDDFADDVAGLVQVAEGSQNGGVDNSFLRHQASQRFGADLQGQQARTLQSGDDDLAPRLQLAERRSKMDSIRAKAAARAVDGAGAPELPSRKRVREEDDTYAAAKQASQAKKQAKQQTYSAKPMRAPKADPTTQEARGITKDIVKNRGLTPHRSKANKNPRKKHRNKFEKALVRRKGQVQEARAGTAGGYGGEQTGIKSNVTRGVKF